MAEIMARMARLGVLMSAAGMLLCACALGAAQKSTATAAPSATATPRQATAPTPQPTQTHVVSADNYILIGRYLMHLYCSGQGNPAVILDPGLGGTHESWAPIQAKVSGITRVCSVDRLTRRLYPGLPVHTTRMIVRHLHALLKRAGLVGPYVLVGQSIAGWDVGLFTGEYRSQVAGIVLSDATPPNLFTRLDAILPAKLEPLFDAKVLGAPRKVENLNIVRSAKQVESVRSLGKVPLMVVSRGIFSAGEHISITPAEKRRFERLWSRLQDNLARGSTNSVHVIATKSEHAIYKDQPQLLVEAIRQVVAAARTPPHILPPCGPALQSLQAQCVSSPSRSR